MDTQVVQGPYVNGAPDQRPEGFDVPFIEIVFPNTLPMWAIQRLVTQIHGVMLDERFENIRIECNFLELVDPGAPLYNTKS